MAEGIVYLDVDDEITSAAQRIRSAPGTRVALVVPYGSRIATSRMNFRLLSREAVMNSKRLSIVSGDAAARSLAASAGLPVFGSVGEYESSLVDPGSPGGAGDAPAVGAATAGTAAAATLAADAGLAASETVVVPTADPEGADTAGTPTRRSQRPKRPVGTATTAVESVAPAAAIVATPPTRPSANRSVAAQDATAADATDTAKRLPPVLGLRIRAPVVAALGLLALALIVAAVGAYVFLPSAEVSVTPRRDSIGPLEITVSADPTVTVVDPDTSVVPAILLDVPVEARRTFTTTGKHVEEAPARGSVTFTNYDTSSGVSIQSGSIVSTEGGTRFRTTQTAILQPAGILPFTPKTDSVPVVAAKTGEGGNVPANTIRVVPQGQNPDLLKVNNPADTSGGTRTETPEVTQAEVDKAVAALQVDLDKAFADAVAAGTGAPPETKLFPETATPGLAVPDPDPKSLVGQAIETFELRLSAKGTVIAVDPRPVTTIARAELANHLTADHRLLEDTVAIVVGKGTVGEDGQVSFQATVRATQVLIVDAAALPGLVKGKTKAEAEAALAQFGTASVTLWPDWVSTVTAVDARLTVTVNNATTGSGPGGPSQSPTASSGVPRSSPSPARSAAPGPSNRPSASASAAAP